MSENRGKEIKLNGVNVFYTQNENHRARSIRITIDVYGSIRVTKPKLVSIERVESFIKSKSKWILSKLEHFKSIDKSLVINTKRGDFKKYKKEAQTFVTKKLLEWNEFYNFSYKNISVKNQKTRWGSCSKRGNLNFNYKILFLPEDLADYIVVHELCHLGELNHSKRFWQLVGKTIPEYKKAKARLKKVISR